MAAPYRDPLASSINLTEAAKLLWDIAVVGAGPAGSTAAREAARAGASVLLIDRAKFPRWKVCGCCLNARSLNALDGAGLSDLVEAGAPLTHIDLVAGGRRARIPLPQYRALSRECLDTALIMAAQESGVAFLSETTAALASVDEHERRLNLSSGAEREEVRARIVIAANGLGKRLLGGTDSFSCEPARNSRIGAGTVIDAPSSTFEAGVIHMACGSGGYMGLVRLEDGRLDIAAAFDSALLRQHGGMPGAAKRLLDEAGLVTISGLESAKWKGTPALTRKASRRSAHRALVLGDAAGYVEPFTGEGISWAITAGSAAGVLAAKSAKHFDPGTEYEWNHLYKTLVKRRQFHCRGLAMLLRQQRMVRLLVPVIGRVPGIARPIVRGLNRSDSGA